MPYRTNTRLVSGRRRSASLGRVGGIKRGIRGGPQGRSVSFSSKVGSKVVPKLRLKVKAMSKHQKATPLPNRSGSESAYKIMLKNKGLLKKYANRVRPLTLTYNNGNYTTGGAGKQVVAVLGALYDRPDMHNMNTTASVQEFGGTGTQVGYKTLQIYLKSGFATYSIVNPSNASMRITLYDILPRRDGYQTIGGNYVTPDACWSEGMLQQQGNSTTPTFNDLGCRPYDSQLFNDFFKVKCTTYVDLAPGQCHYHRVNFHPHKFIDRDIIDQSSSVMSCFKGLTLYTLAVVQGQPVNDNAASITTEATKIDWVQSISYHYSYVSNNMTTTYLESHVATTAGTTLENLVKGASDTFAQV